MQMRNKVEKDIECFIRPFVQMCSFSGVQFPLLQTTYSLWRKVCYKHMQQKYEFENGSSEERQLKRAFIKVSQRKLFKQFESKLNEQIDGQSVGWRKAILQADELRTINSPYYNQLFFEYCELIYQLQLQVELFYDLVSIPYSEVYSDGKEYLLNEKFKTSFYSKKDETFADKVCGKIGKNIISKGLGKISETVFSNRFIYSMTGILSTVNPLAMIASMSISHVMQQHQRSSKQKHLVDELIFLISLIKNHLIELKQTYEKCLCSIQAMAQLEQNQNQQLEREKKRFFETLSTVLTEDWLQIKVTKQGEWEFVQLTNRNIHEFEDLQLTRSQQQKAQFTSNSSLQ